MKFRSTIRSGIYICIYRPISGITLISRAMWRVTSFPRIGSESFFRWRWGGSSAQAWMPTYVSILRIPQMIWVGRATVEWYWQGKTEELGEEPVPSTTLSTTNPIWIDPGANPGLRGERPVTNDLSHGTAICVLFCFRTFTIGCYRWRHERLCYKNSRQENPPDTA
jgi:hypothetical protein